MGKVKAQLRYGYWPDGSAPDELSSRAHRRGERLAASALEGLNRLGVNVALDKAGKAYFHATRIPSPTARLTIERQGDLIEAYLVERAKRRLSGRRSLADARHGALFASIPSGEARRGRLRRAMPTSRRHRYERIEGDGHRP